jgi:ribonuclease P protein subunit POP4
MNAETLPRHELVGLHVEVVASPNADLVGVSGEVVDETMHTLLVAGESRVRQVPKAAATFEFDLDGDHVVVEGVRLVARPARRTEQTGDSKWR